MSDRAEQAEIIAKIHEWADSSATRGFGTATVSHKRIVALSMALRSLEADSRRLDALEKAALDRPLLLHDGDADTKGHRGLGLNPGRLRRSLRDAIDSAFPDSPETPEGLS